jgi:hypothetical protein
MSGQSPGRRDVSMDMVVSRHEAARRGLTYYFTGKLCVNGHLTSRYVCNGSCFDCQREINRDCRRRLREIRGGVRVRR